MKFEHLLQVYWLKGFLYGGNIIPFDVRSNKLFKHLKGLATYSSYNLIKKFEMTSFFKKKQTCLNLDLDEQQMINTYFSYVTSVNHSVNEFLRLNAVRLYLIKSYKGRCQAIGKPSRGQRSRSNAKTSNKTSNNVKFFISEFKKMHVKIEALKKINYRIKQKKTKRTAPQYKKKTTKKKTNLWF